MKVKNIIKRTSMSIKHNAPDILVTTGIVGMISSTVLACKATPKVETIISECKKSLMDVEDTLMEDREDYTEKDGVKDRRLLKIQAGVAIGKAYLPAVVLTSVSIASILKSHNILKHRLASVSTALGTMTTAFIAYRERVAAKYGEEEEHDIRYNVKTETVDGATKKDKKTVKKSVSGLESPYSEFFMQDNLNWEKDALSNIMFLKSRQQYANDLLRANHKVYLNEVLDMLGMRKTDAGQMVGWIYDPENPKAEGDNYIDFGISQYFLNSEKIVDINDGIHDIDEPVILLDFNVDGVVWKKRTPTKY